MKKVVIAALIALSTLGTVSAQDKPKCKATTSKGLPCKIQALANGYCSIHNPDALRCGALTASGKPCKQRVKVAGAHCRFHS